MDKNLTLHHLLSKYRLIFLGKGLITDVEISDEESGRCYIFSVDEGELDSTKLSELKQFAKEIKKYYGVNTKFLINDGEDICTINF